MMTTTEHLFLEWGVRQTYPITEEEFYSLLKEEGEKVWIIENQANGDGTYTNQLDINGHKYIIVTSKKLQQ
jgi:hypothetical protein